MEEAAARVSNDHKRRKKSLPNFLVVKSWERNFAVDLVYINLKSIWHQLWIASCVHPCSLELTCMPRI
jgi:hypothetical protein